MEMSMMVRYSSIFFNRILTTLLGEWENDKANGYGIYTHANGSRY